MKGYTDSLFLPGGLALLLEARSNRATMQPAGIFFVFVTFLLHFAWLLSIKS